jgi:hypothetical protein
MFTVVQYPLVQGDIVSLYSLTSRQTPVKIWQVGSEKI